MPCGRVAGVRKVCALVIASWRRAYMDECKGVMKKGALPFMVAHARSEHLFTLVFPIDRSRESFKRSIGPLVPRPAVGVRAGSYRLALVCAVDCLTLPPTWYSGARRVLSVGGAGPGVSAHVGLSFF